MGRTVSAGLCKKSHKYIDSLCQDWFKIILLLEAKQQIMPLLTLGEYHPKLATQFWWMEQKIL